MADDVKTAIDDDPEPEGVMEIETPSDGGVKVKQAVVPATAIRAERARIRSVEREKQATIQRELDAERQKNQALANDLQAVRPHIEHLQKNPHLLKAGESPEIQAISDDEASAYAKDYELYTATGLDVSRAKRMIARENRKVTEASMRAAQAAVEPLQQGVAQNQSAAFLSWALNQRGSDGALLADPEILREVWAATDPSLTSNPIVARDRLEVAIGKTLLAGKRPAAPMQREPTFTEPSGGFRDRVYEMSPMEKTIAGNHGVSDKDWTETAKRYVPGRTNRLGE